MFPSVLFQQFLRCAQDLGARLRRRANASTFAISVSSSGAKAPNLLRPYGTVEAVP